MLFHVLEKIKSPLVGKRFCNADLFVIIAIITLFTAVHEQNVTNSMLVTQKVERMCGQGMAVGIMHT